MKEWAKAIAAYFLGVLSVCACASTPVYHWYNASFSENLVGSLDVGKPIADLCYSNATLLGKTGDSTWPDLPYAECQPDASVKGKCVTQLAADFFAKDQALQICESQLNTCQNGG